MTNKELQKKIEALEEVVRKQGVLLRHFIKEGAIHTHGKPIEEIKEPEKKKS